MSGISSWEEPSPSSEDDEAFVLSESEVDVSDRIPGSIDTYLSSVASGATISIWIYRGFILPLVFISIFMQCLKCNYYFKNDSNSWMMGYMFLNLIEF